MRFNLGIMQEDVYFNKETDEYEVKLEIFITEDGGDIKETKKIVLKKHMDAVSFNIDVQSKAVIDMDNPESIKVM